MSEVASITKRLANSEKEIRDKGLESLRDFLSSGKELSRNDQLKVWEAIYQCFWLTDKVDVQQALAYDLASLILITPTSYALSFISAFWEVHCKKWSNLPRNRHDKFFSLFRRIISYSFQWLAKNNWDKETIDAYNSMMLDGPLHPSDYSKPHGIRFHIIDIYQEELIKVINGEEDRDESAKDEEHDEGSDAENDEENDDEEADSEDEASVTSQDEDTTETPEKDEKDVPFDELIQPLWVLSEKAPYKKVRERAEDALMEEQEIRQTKKVKV